MTNPRQADSRKIRQSALANSIIVLARFCLPVRPPLLTQTRTCKQQYSSGCSNHTGASTSLATVATSFNFSQGAGKDT